MCAVCTCNFKVICHCIISHYVRLSYYAHLAHNRSVIVATAAAVADAEFTGSNCCGAYITANIPGEKNTKSLGKNLHGKLYRLPDSPVTCNEYDIL